MKTGASLCIALTGSMAIAAGVCRADPTDASSTVVPIQQARIQLGQNYPEPIADAQDGAEGTRVQLDALEVQGRALPGISENSSQADIPFGLAGVAWSLRHPSEAERLFLPVQN